METQIGAKALSNETGNAEIEDGNNWIDEQKLEASGRLVVIEETSQETGHENGKECRLTDAQEQSESEPDGGYQALMPCHSCR